MLYLLADEGLKPLAERAKPYGLDFSPWKGLCPFNPVSLEPGLSRHDLTQAPRIAVARVVDPPQQRGDDRLLRFRPGDVVRE